MPKQPYDVSKNLRLIYVWEAIKLLGRATPERVLQTVASRLGVEASSNFKRTIYRDLKVLADSGDVGVEYFTPDGSKVDIEDEIKNVRVEYFLKGEEGHVPGGGLIAQIGGLFIPPRLNLVNWAIHDLSQGQINGRFSILVGASFGRYVSVSAPLADRPFKVILARAPESKDQIPESRIIEEKFGTRTALLLLNDKSLSRISRGEKSGHALIDVTKVEGVISLTNLQAASSWLWAPVSPTDLENLYRRASSSDTAPATEGSFHVTSSWRMINETRQDLPLPLYLRSGSLTLCVSAD